MTTNEPTPRDLAIKNAGPDRILAAIEHFGDASTGQIAVRIKASTADTEAALVRLHSIGRVAILPKSLTWTLPDAVRS